MRSIIYILAFFALLSCTVQRRHYQKGYFVSWKKQSAERKDLSDKQAKKPAWEASAHPERSTAQAQKIPAFVPQAEYSGRAHIKPKTTPKTGEDSCDVILFKNGSETRVRLTEISSTQVKYKKCDVPDGPVYISNKTEIFMITHANGMKEVLKVPETQVSTAPAKTPATRTRPRKKNTKLATLSLIFSILGFYPAIFIGGIAAIIMSIIQLNKILLYPDEYGGERKAKVSLILGIASVVAWTCIIGLIILTL